MASSIYLYPNLPPPTVAPRRHRVQPRAVWPTAPVHGRAQGESGRGLRRSCQTGLAGLCLGLTVGHGWRGLALLRCVALAQTVGVVKDHCYSYIYTSKHTLLGF